MAVFVKHALGYLELIMSKFLSRYDDNISAGDRILPKSLLLNSMEVLRHG